MENTQGKHKTDAPFSTVKAHALKWANMGNSKQSLDGRRGQAETRVLKLS